jgi:hypothetical protein
VVKREFMKKMKTPLMLKNTQMKMTKKMKP